MRAGKILRGRPARDTLTETPPLLAGTYVFGGVLHPHFGHMIAEFMHRLWPLERPELRDAVPLFSRRIGAGNEGLVRGILALMNLPEPVFVDHPVTVERLIVGEPAKMLGSQSAPGYADFLERRLGHLRSSGPRHPRRLAVLRGHQTSGRCIGETWLERELEKAGYFAFHPENFPMRVQMEHYLDAEKVIFSEGSAIHVIDLMPRLDAEIAVLNRRSASIASCSLTDKCAALHMFDGIFIGHPSFDPRMQPQGLSWADMTAFTEMLRDKGFIDAVPETDFFRDPAAIRDDLVSYLRSARDMRGRDISEEALTAEALAFAVRGIGIAARHNPPRRRPVARASA